MNEQTLEGMIETMLADFERIEQRQERTKALLTDLVRRQQEHERGIAEVQAWIERLESRIKERQ
jgi:hypothetical protein